MKKIVFCKLMLSLKRNIPIFLLYFVGYVVLSFIAVNFVTSWFIVNSPEALSAARSGDRSLLTEAVVAILTENLRVYGCVIMFFELALIWLISLRLPLQLPRALYVCPAGRTDKLRYLKFYLAVKLLFLVFVLIAIDVTGWGGNLSVVAAGCTDRPDQPYVLSVSGLQSHFGSRQPPRCTEKMS